MDDKLKALIEDFQKVLGTKIGEMFESPEVEKSVEDIRQAGYTLGLGVEMTIVYFRVPGGQGADGANEPEEETEKSQFNWSSDKDFLKDLKILDPDDL